MKIISPDCKESKNKENQKNSPLGDKKRSSTRIKDLSKQIRKRTSLGGLLSPVKRNTNASYTYPQSLLSPQLNTEHSKALKDAIENPNRKRANLLKLHNLEKKKAIRIPTPRPNLRPLNQTTPTPQSSKPDLLSPLKSSDSNFAPALSRSISLYSLPQIVEEEEEKKKKSKSSRLSASFSRPGPRTPKKKKDSTSMSLRNTRKRSVTDFKQLFLRGSSQSSIKNVDNQQDSQDEEEKPKKYFSVDLEELMHIQRTIFGIEDIKIPYFMHVCCSQIREFYLEEEGLFRVSPSLTILEEAVDFIESCDDFGKTNLQFGKITSEIQNPENPDEKQTILKTQFKSHVYSGLIKKYLRDLPNPLLGVENYDSWISCVSPKENIDSVKTLLLQLPTDHYNLLECIVYLAGDISKNQNANRMSIENLSRVIGPNILWNNASSDPLFSSEQICLINRLSELLITHRETLFESCNDDKLDENQIESTNNNSENDDSDSSETSDNVEKENNLETIEEIQIPTTDSISDEQE